MTSSDDPFPTDAIRTNEAAKLMGVSPATVWRWILKGWIRGWKRGIWRVSRSEVLGNWTPKKPAPTHPEAVAFAKLKATAPPSRQSAG